VRVSNALWAILQVMLVTWHEQATQLPQAEAAVVGGSRTSFYTY
jgi:hypothetical protein